MNNSIARLGAAVMHGVARALPAGKTVADYGQAVDVMRSELKALLTSAEYADARDCVVRRSVHEGYIIGLVVANCLLKIPLKAA